MHSIRAIVGPRQSVTDVIAAAGSPPVTELVPGMVIMPLGDAQLGRLIADGSREVVGGFGYLTSGLELALAATSTRGPFAYIETEYFGGSGGQASVVFSPGAAPVRFTEGAPINSALRSIGVKARPGADEFDTLGLGRFRRLERLGLTDDGTPCDPSPARPGPGFAAVETSQPRKHRPASLWMLTTVALAVLVMIFWIGLSVLAANGFDLTMPSSLAPR